MSSKLVKKRDSLKASLKRLLVFTSKPPDDITIADINVKLDRAQKIFKEISNVQLEIDELTGEAEIEFQEFEMADIETISDTVHARLTELLIAYQKDEVTEAQPINPVVVRTPTPNELKLRAIDIPKFDGRYELWRSFYDMFSSLIDKREGLCGSEKLYYLKMYLEGEAAQLIRAYQVTDANYNIAWQALKSRYENKRLIVNALLKKLFTQKIVSNESAPQLRSLLDTTLECVQALNSLDLPTDEWDSILVFIVSQRLDTDSHKQWELSLSHTELSTFEELKEFIEKRCRSLEAVANESTKRRTDTKQFSMRTSHHVTTGSTCSMCNSSGHMITTCPDFLKLEVRERTNIVRQRNLCFNCLRFGHSTYNCNSSRCRKCRQRHNSLLHYPNSGSQSNINNKASVSLQQSICPQKDEPTQNNSMQIQHASINTLFGNKNQQAKQILLATALAKVKTYNGHSELVRILLDSGSQGSFITENCVQRLRLHRKPMSIPINGLGAGEVGRVNGTVHLSLSSCINRKFEIEVDALIFKKLTGKLPTNEICVRELPNFSGIRLADPEFYKPSDIDILLGSDVYGELLLDGIIKGKNDQPTAQNTELGWVLFGPIVSHNPIYSNLITINMHLDLEQAMRRFWKIEEVCEANLMSKEDEVCEKHFCDTYSRDHSGRFIVRLPFNETPVKLGESKHTAFRRLVQIEKRLNENYDVKHQYVNFMQEYEQLNHMQQTSKIEDSSCYFIPHHFVKKEDSSTTKLRVVFDASCKTTNGTSLNEKQLVGAKLQDDLIVILLRFRKHKIAVTADIAKMYRQILIHPDDRKYQQILWRSSVNDPIQQFTLNTVTYGMAAAPFLAIRSLRQLAVDNEVQYADASRIILSDFYVDDMITGFENDNMAIQRIKELENILASGGFDLRKWSSNNENVLNFIPEDKREIQNVSLEFSENNSVKTLGLIWQPSIDCFRYKVNESNCEKPITKRTILSSVAQLFDPLGLLAPVIIVSKILLQNLWTLGIDWDESVPLSTVQHWKNYRSTLGALETIKVPRWLGMKIDETYELHAFCDASEVAYAAVIYIRIIHNDGSYSTQLITAKTKVAPISQVSLPRLELCAAVLLIKLFVFVQKTFRMENVGYYAWSDSRVVLAWLRKLPRNWKTFVANRVSYIQTHSSPDRWRHIPSQLNPADSASRGIMPKCLVNNKLWWNGPEFLIRDEMYWPVGTDQVNTVLEARNISVNVSVIEPVWNIIEKYSNLTLLKRVTAYVMRFAKNLTVKAQCRARGFLTANELQGAVEFWVRNAQAAEFNAEIQCCKSGRPLPCKSRLLPLNPVLDDRGLLRVGGRISMLHHNGNRLRPFILPKKYYLINLIVADAHNRLLHGGVKLMLDFIRRRFWIIGVRSVVKKYVHDCVVCFRQKPKISEQLMGKLPIERTMPLRPFIRCGVDYAGPLPIKISSGRGTRSTKGYIALFVCFATKAIHLELASDMTTNTFLAAFKRFVSRRGRCTDIYSDRGTNFVGAHRELGILLKSVLNNDTIPRIMASDGINWHFIPAGSPHFGGLWEAGVKSVKHHLRRIVGQNILTFEEMMTTLTEIEACLNSRPYCEQTDDPDDIAALTPGHFLIGESMMVLPDSDMTLVPINRLTRWKLVKQLTQHFWYRWRDEYLTTLQQRPKWLKQKENVKVGQLVVIKNERSPPGTWPLARITKVHPGSDGLVRCVSLKYYGGETTRAIHKICVLPNQ